MTEKLIRAATLGVCLGSCAVWLLDARVGAFFADYPVHGTVGEFFDAAEQFGTPFGQILVLLVLSRLISPASTSTTGASVWDPRVLRVFVTTVIAGLSANIGKLIVARTRPREFDFTLSLADGFGGWFPFGHGGNSVQSFPSAHTASAFGFAAALAWMWPRHRWLFFFLASLVGVQRVVVGAHFPSDVIAGATLGYLVATLYLSNGWVNRCWLAIENWCWRQQGISPMIVQTATAPDSTET